jgi:hypothetical protein
LTTGGNIASTVDRRCRRRRLVAALGAATLTFAGCSAGDSTTSGAASTPATQSRESSSGSSSSPPDCPNFEGGLCLGELDPGISYTTKVFTPELTYRVPTSNWFNYEDTPGNFLLVPPGNDLAGVNAGTSDFIGVYTAVVPARIIDPSSCVFEAVPGNWSPETMAVYYRKRPNLTTSRVLPVAIGGLTGVMVDMRMKPGSKPDVCNLEGERLEFAGEFTGVTPSSLDHAVIPGMTMRMIMLNSAGKVLLVEVDDIDNAPIGLSALTSVSRHMRFGS